MLSDEEMKAIEGIKKDDEYYDILENIKQNKYNMLNVEKLMRDTTTGDYTEYEIAQSIVYFVNLIEKQSKEIEILNKNMNLLREQNISYKQSIHGLKEMNKIINKKWEDKIKAKIEELKERKRIAQERRMYVNVESLDIIIRFLQSLLEKE